MTSSIQHACTAVNGEIPLLTGPELSDPAPSAPASRRPAQPPTDPHPLEIALTAALKSWLAENELLLGMSLRNAYAGK
jgi:hypothetical protein